MGSTISSLNVPNGITDYFAIQMDRSNRLRLILAPKQIIDATYNAISQIWPIEDVSSIDGYTEIKLEGHPWHVFRTESLIMVINFLCVLLGRYSEQGWGMKSSSDLSRSDTDCSVLFFERKIPITAPVMSLSLNEFDKIRVVGPAEVRSILTPVLANSQFGGIQREQPLGIGYEYKLCGYLWTAEKSETNVLVNQIFKALHRNGWSFIGAIDAARQETRMNALYFQWTGIPSTNDEFIAISLKQYDKIRFHEVSSGLISTITNELPKMWPGGIQKYTPKPEKLTDVFKLEGYPWESNFEDAITSRALINYSIWLLSNHGFDMYGTCDTSHVAIKKSSLFFKSRPSGEPIKKNFCISLNSWNKLRVINGNEMIVDSVRKALDAGWYKGVNGESCDNNIYHEFELSGSPFVSHTSEKKVNVAVMMLTLFQYIEPLGFKLLSSADTSCKRDDNKSIDVHAFFFGNK